MAAAPGGFLMSWIVNLSGIALIAAIVWWFWLAKR